VGGPGGGSRRGSCLRSNANQPSQALRDGAVALQREKGLSLREQRSELKDGKEGVSEGKIDLPLKCQHMIRVKFM